MGRVGSSYTPPPWKGEKTFWYVSVEYFFLCALGRGIKQGGAGDGGGRGTQSVRGNRLSFKGKNVTVVEELHQLFMYILSDVQPAKKGRCV